MKTRKRKKRNNQQYSRKKHRNKPTTVYHKKNSKKYKNRRKETKKHRLRNIKDNIHTRKKNKFRPIKKRKRQHDDTGRGWGLVPEYLVPLTPPVRRGVEPIDEEPVIIHHADAEVSPLDGTKEYRNRLEEYYNNDLRNSIIRWKRSKLSEYINMYDDPAEIEWVIINEPSQNNYLHYLLDEMHENISDKPRSGWVISDSEKAKLGKEAKDILGKTDLGTTERENFWIDPRVLGKKWLGLFRSVTPMDEIKHMEVPEM